MPGTKTTDDGRRAAVPWAALLLAAATLALAWAVRIFAVEQPELAWVCQSTAPPWWCPLYQGAILTLRTGVIGFAALAAGGYAICKGRPRWGMLAVAAGAAGLVLYVPEPAAGGLLLGAMTLLRR